MLRCFVAIGLPAEVQTALARLQAALPLPRPAAAESFHLTLAFLGDIVETAADEAHLALAALRAPGFALTLEGVALFGGAKPRVVYAAVAPQPALMALQAKVEVALRRAGLSPDARRFTPHVTLGRLTGGRAEAARVEAAAAAAAGFRAGPWRVAHFGLWRSDPAPGGRIHAEIMRYPLTAGRAG